MVTGADVDGGTMVPGTAVVDGGIVVVVELASVVVGAEVVAEPAVVEPVVVEPLVVGPVLAVGPVVDVVSVVTSWGGEQADSTVTMSRLARAEAEPATLSRPNRDLFFTRETP